jgi:hypothetical protein
MSIGDLTTYGNKGNNFPWQLKVLQGLQAVVDNNCCVDILALLANIDNSLRPKERTPGVISTTTSGTTVLGWYSFSIANVGAAAGTVGGQSIPAGTTLNFDGGALNNTLGSLAYDATGTTFIITYIL